MIKIENVSVYGFEEAIRGMRNPYESWDRSDSEYKDGSASLGKNDISLALDLAKAGPVHAKYRRMIQVYADITAPLYWWKEYDTYKVGTVANSCSTMHCIHKREFTLDDFSHEHLTGFESDYDSDRGGERVPDSAWVDSLKNVVTRLNNARDIYVRTKDKKYWWAMIQLLPSSYNQKRTIMASYEALANIYRQRKDHKLDEWRTFCEWVWSLPYGDIVTTY